LRTVVETSSSSKLSSISDEKMKSYISSAELATDEDQHIKYLKRPTKKYFLMPHTHTDLGWLMTVDQYYTTQVSKILSTIVTALWGKPWRKFVFSDIGYFKIWYEELEDSEVMEKVEH
jgi:hypothetical protein